MLSINEEFVNLYKKLDYIKDHDPDLYNRFKERYGIIDSFRNMRNVLCHVDNPGEVSLSFLNQLKDMVNKMSVKVESLCVKTNKVYYATLEDDIDSILKIMDDLNYSFIPILDDDDHILGVISEKTIFSIMEHNSELIHNNRLVRDCYSYFKLNNNPNYYYAFVSRKELAINIKDLFLIEKDGKRCGVAFVTENGKSNESVLGIVNSWDLLKV